MYLSLILPVYNEEPNLKKGTIEKVLQYLKKQKYSYEILIIDDGSSDNTASLIKKKYKDNKLIRLVEKKHEGKAYSVIKGIEEAKGKVIFFSDFDLATPIEELEKLLTYINEGYDIVIGSRSSVRKGAPIARKIMAKGWILVRDVVVGLHGIKDTQCGFKAFKSEAAKKIITKFRVFDSGHEISGPSVSAAFDLELLYIGKLLKYKIKEVPVIWTHVETRNVSIIRDTYESLKDIAKIKLFTLQGKYK